MIVYTKPFVKYVSLFHTRHFPLITYAPAESRNRVGRKSATLSFVSDQSKLGQSNVEGKHGKY